MLELLHPQIRGREMATQQELSDRYLQLSRKFMGQAQTELELGDLAQASEKVWGAAAEGLKSIAAQRGWNHKSHGLLRDMATHLYMEFGHPPIYVLFGFLEGAHVNFYEHRFDKDEVRYQIDNCREFLDELDRIRALPPRAFTPSNREQERRLERLTRFSPETTADEDLDITELPPV